MNLITENTMSRKVSETDVLRVLHTLWCSGRLPYVSVGQILEEDYGLRITKMDVDSLSVASIDGRTTQTV